MPFRTLILSKFLASAAAAMCTIGCLLAVFGADLDATRPAPWHPHGCCGSGWAGSGCDLA